MTVLYKIPFGEKVSKLILFSRASEWIDKIQMNLGTTFIILLDSVYNNFENAIEISTMVAIFIIYQFFIGSYGYAINAYADHKIDLLVQKDRGVSYFSKLQLSIILLFLTLGSLGIPLLLPDPRAKIIGIITFILASSYSLKPIHLKTRGFWGIVGVTLPQRPLMILLFGVMVNARPELVGILIGWSLLIGMIMEIGHQMLDYKNDSISKTQTWIQTINSSELKKYNLIIIVLSILFVLSPFYYFAPRIGFTLFLIMIVFSGHSFFYFFDGWKKYMEVKNTNN